MFRRRALLLCLAMAALVSGCASSQRCYVTLSTAGAPTAEACESGRQLVVRPITETNAAFYVPPYVIGALHYEGYLDDSADRMPPGRPDYGFDAQEGDGAAAASDIGRDASEPHAAIPDVMGALADGPADEAEDEGDGGAIGILPSILDPSALTAYAPSADATSLAAEPDLAQNNSVENEVNAPVSADKYPSSGSDGSHPHASGRVDPRDGWTSMRELAAHAAERRVPSPPTIDGEVRFERTLADRF